MSLVSLATGAHWLIFSFKCLSFGGLLQVSHLQFGRPLPGLLQCPLCPYTWLCVCLHPFLRIFFLNLFITAVLMSWTAMTYKARKASAQTYRLFFFSAVGGILRASSNSRECISGFEARC